MDHTAIDTGHHRLSIWTIIGASSTIDFGRQVGSARRAKDRIRRIFPVPAGSGEGPFTEPTTAARPWRGQPLLMPLLRHSPTAARPSQVGGKRPFGRPVGMSQLGDASSGSMVHSVG
jgi:hypothetical protein